jgi:hypothetical protein
MKLPIIILLSFLLILPLTSAGFGSNSNQIQLTKLTVTSSGGTTNNYINNSYLNQTVINGSSYNSTYDAKNTSQWIRNGGDIYYQNLTGKVGIGTSSPLSLLSLVSLDNTLTTDILKFTYDGSGNYRSGIGVRYTNANPSANNMDFRVSDGSVSGQTTVLDLLGNGVVNIPTNIASTSATTGSLTVAGGLGVAGQTTTGKLQIANGKLASYTTLSGAPQTGNDAFKFDTSISTALHGGTYATAPYTFWLQNVRESDGSVFPLGLNPIGGDIYLGNTTSKTIIVGTTASTSTTTGALTVAGGLGVAGATSSGGGSANQAVCWKSNGQTLGYCSTAVNSTGGCTCN